MADRPPRAIILAGANGSGKTTAARTILAETLRVVAFVNADVIAQGLSGFDPEAAAFEASRIMLERLHALAERREDFAFETTLAARTYAAWLKKLQADGYTVDLNYVWLRSADLNVARVAERVRLGGHDVPEKTIRQRRRRSLENFFRLYLPLVDTWQVYDNTLGSEPRVIAAGGKGKVESVMDREAWEEMKKGLSND